MAPADVKGKFVKQCGVLVRDYVLITFREWKQAKDKGVSYVSPIGKHNLWKRLKKNFILPEPEVASDEEDPDEDELQRRRDWIEVKVKKFALRKMAQQFSNWKKRLLNEYVKENKTLDFDKQMYAKIKDD